MSNRIPTPRPLLRGPMSRPVRRWTSALLMALLTLPPLGLFSREAHAFSPAIHREITEEALWFIREGVLDDMKDEHGDWADAPVAADVKWVHADSCAMSETATQINEFYKNAILNLVPGADFDPWSATDDYGRVFHPSQDFYSHSNWVELGFPVSDVVVQTSDLVDFGTTFAGVTHLGPWRTPRALETVRDDIIFGDLVEVTLTQRGENALDLADVNGDGAVDERDTVITDFPSGWNIGLLPHPTLPDQAGYIPGIDTTGDAQFTSITAAGGFSVPIMLSGADRRMLITAVGGRPIHKVWENQCDPYQRDHNGQIIEPKEINGCRDDEYGTDYSCFAYGSRHALTHDGSDRSELKKDKPGDAPTRHPKARALAVMQSKYEWCRMVNLAGEAGADGTLLSLWVRDGASANPEGTPCGPDDGRGPRGVTVGIESVEILDDKEDSSGGPGEINLSLALYDRPLEFHRLHKSHAGPEWVGDPGSLFGSTFPEDALPGPLSMCVPPDNPTFRVALHGWDDDDGVDIGPNPLADGDFESHDDAMIGFSATEFSNAIPVNTLVRRHVESGDMRVTYSMQRVADTDNDKMDLCGEDWYGTDPDVPDTDNDGLLDGVEVEGGNPTQPTVDDSDQDGLKDGTEDKNHDGSLTAGETDPNDADSDDDLLTDGVEVNGSNPTNPLDPDTDRDGLKDGREDANHNGALDPGETNPNDADSDDDLLNDGFEVTVGTDPLNPDSDGDGLIDGKDVDWLKDAINALPAGAIKSPAAGNRNAMLNLLADAEALLKKGKIKPALDKLNNLRSHVDGCGSRSDTNDWVIDCAGQIPLHQLVDLLIANVTA